MKNLKPPYDHIGADILAMFKHWHEEHGKDWQSYPIGASIQTLLQKYEVKLRPVPLTDEDILDNTERLCVVCGKELGSAVWTAAKRGKYTNLCTHPECISDDRKKQLF